MGRARDVSIAGQLATLPMRLGGAGLRSAERTAPAAYWASVADALPRLELLPDEESLTQDLHCLEWSSLEPEE